MSKTRTLAQMLAPKVGQGPLRWHSRFRFQRLLLKSGTVAVVVYAGFEHPSEVQHEIVQSKLCWGDIICRWSERKRPRRHASDLHQLNPPVAAAVDGADAAGATESKSSVQVLVLCHTRELVECSRVRTLQVFAFHQGRRLYGGVNITPRIFWPTTVPIVVSWTNSGLGETRVFETLDSIHHFVWTSVIAS
jgi:hypothetical protein